MSDLFLTMSIEVKQPSNIIAAIGYQRRLHIKAALRTCESALKSLDNQASLKEANEPALKKSSK